MGGEPPARGSRQSAAVDLAYPRRRRLFATRARGRLGTTARRAERLDDPNQDSLIRVENSLMASIQFPVNAQRIPCSDG